LKKAGLNTDAAGTSNDDDEEDTEFNVSLNIKI